MKTQKSMSKINAVLARALAEQASSKIRTILNGNKNTGEIAAKSSSELKDLNKLMKKRDAVNKQIDSLKTIIYKKYDVSVTSYNRTASIQAKSISFPSVSEIKNKIIIANHVSGVSEAKLIDYVCDQYKSK